MMAALDMTTLWLQTASACGPCDTDGVPPACTASGLGPVCARPQLDGPAATLARLMAALDAVPCTDDGRSLVGAGQVASLRVTPDEAELVLNLPRGCGRQRLAAERAFQALRRALPDTDIYVVHAA
jgi:hypothetical protein